MANAIVTLNGRQSIVTVGAGAATAAAATATAAAASASASAALAEATAGPTYASKVAGEAATSPGQTFAVNNGDGTVTIWLRTSGASVAQRTLATTAYLAGTSGAAQIGSSTGETVEDRLSRVVYLENFGGGTSKTAAQNTTALQNAIAALPAGGGSVLFGASRGTYNLNALTISRHDVTLGADGGTPTLAFPSITTGAGLLVTGNRVSMKGITTQGPGSAATYVGGQCVVAVRGSSTSSRVDGFKAINCKFSNSGMSGLQCIFTDWVEIIDCSTTETAYIGIDIRSCNYVTHRGGTLNVLNAVGTSGNAYGVAYTHDSTNYNTNPNPGTPQATNPFCNVVLCDGVTVIGPKIWQAIDTHGAYNITVVNCKTFGAGRGISLTTGSGDAIQYAGWQNMACNNTVDTKLPDGTQPSGIVIADGLTIRGPTTGTAQWSLIVSNNIIRGYGIANSVSAGPINASAGNRNYVITGNIIDDWAGAAIIFGGNGSGGAVIDGNIIGDNRNPASESSGAGACIALNNTLAGKVVISNNVHNPNSGKEARWGIGGSGYNPSSPLIVMGINDFRSATAGLTNTNDFNLHGTGFPGAIQVSGVSGSITVDVSPGLLAPGIPLKVRFQSLTGPVTVTNFTGAMRNMNIIVENLDATNSVTITRNNAFLPGSVNAVLGQYDTICLARSATLWTATSGVNANG